LSTWSWWFRRRSIVPEGIVVAVTAEGESGKAIACGTFPNPAAGQETLVKRLRQDGSGPLKICYEAGPCGCGVHRALSRVGKRAG
jgi:hypothetical protein